MQSRFADVLEAVEELPIDEKEELIKILNNRAAEYRRTRLVRAVEDAEREFEEGLCKSMSVDEFLEEVSA